MQRAASGVVTTLQRFGGVFGVGAVFAANGSLTAPASVPAGFRPALAVSAGLSVLGAARALAGRGSQDDIERDGAVHNRRETLLSAGPVGSCQQPDPVYTQSD